MVTVKVPVGVLFLDVIFKVDVPEPVTLGGVKVAVVLAGVPVLLKVTFPVNPLRAPMVVV